MSAARTPVELWAGIQQALLAVGRSLDDREAATAVPACPAWTVHDVFAHQAGVAADVLAGRMEGAPSDEWTARQVAERVDQPFATVLDEWEATAPRLVEAMAPLGEQVDPRLVIDAWTHLQDVRGALARPGDRDGEATTWVVAAIRRHLEDRIQKAGLPAIAIDVGDGAPPGPGGGLAVDGFELVRAVTGRRSPAQVLGWRWTVEDPHPYAALVPVFTPRQDDLLEPEDP